MTEPATSVSSHQSSSIATRPRRGDSVRDRGRRRFLDACAGRPVDATPVWFMRQAGGRLPRYLALRERHSVIEIAKTPELCAEVTVGAVDALGVDAAVLFADIMLLVEAMGVSLELTQAGPMVAVPIRDDAGVARLREPAPASDLGFVLDAIDRSRRALGDHAALVGILGGPFTLAAYLVEGGPTRDQLTARAMLHARPDLWRALLERLTTASIAYARAQLAAGVDAIQLFDTWASSLTPREYVVHVKPFTDRILAAIDAPSIHHVARSSALLDAIATTPATVVGIDSRQDLGAARARLGRRPVQGNLDPALVLAGQRFAREGADEVLVANDGRPGHVFNLGEAAPRDADPAVLRDLAAHVHDRTDRRGPSIAGPTDGRDLAAGFTETDHA